jgi:hypothetical protein
VSSVGGWSVGSATWAVCEEAREWGACNAPARPFEPAPDELIEAEFPEEGGI